MSMYAGQTAGLMYGDTLRDKEDRRQMDLARIDAGLKEQAMREQGQIHSAQLGLQAQQQAQEAKDEQPAGLPMKAPTPKQPKAVTEGLPDFIRHIEMGNAKRGSKIYNSNGDMRSIPGSEWKDDKTGEVGWTDAETGEKIKLSKEMKEAALRGFKYTPQDETTVAKNIAATEKIKTETGLLKNPGLKGRTESQIYDDRKAAMALQIQMRPKFDELKSKLDTAIAVEADAKKTINSKPYFGAEKKKKAYDAATKQREQIESEYNDLKSTWDTLNAERQGTGLGKKIYAGNEEDLPYPDPDATSPQKAQEPVRMQFPDGKVKLVPAESAKQYIDLGGKPL